MASDGDIAKLQELVAQKDEAINVLKSKTKDFVTKLKTEHQAELEALQQKVLFLQYLYL